MNLRRRSFVDNINSAYNYYIALITDQIKLLAICFSSTHLHYQCVPLLMNSENLSLSCTDKKGTPSTVDDNKRSSEFVKWVMHFFDHSGSLIEFHRNLTVSDVRCKGKLMSRVSMLSL